NPRTSLSIFRGSKPSIVSTLLPPLGHSCRSLDLTRCTLSDSDIGALLQCIDQSPMLQQIKLRKISPKPRKRIAEIAGHVFARSNITELDLSSNTLSAGELNNILQQLLEIATTRRI